MNNDRKVEERILAAREDYRKIPVPEEMKAKLEAGIERAEAEIGRAEAEIGRAEAEIGRAEAEIEKVKTEKGEEKDKEGSGMKKREKIDKRKTLYRMAAAVAAAAALLVILPNTGAEVAYAMGNLPVVGKLFQAVTFRDYQYESERFEANVEVPQIVVEDVGKEEEGMGEKERGTGEKEGGTGEKEGGAGEKEGGAGEKEAGTEEGRESEKGETENRDENVQQTVDEINFDIEQVTGQLIEEFQESAELGESYGSLEIHHETVTDNENYFTLKLSMYRGAGSGFESYKFYTVDKRTGKRIQIGDLFQEDSNYNELISEDIKEQMRTQMAEDEGKVYWVDYEEVPEWSWERLKEDQNFYFDAEGNIVIVFDEYEVAPGYMGAREFTVQRALFEGILK